jgi:mono/diheme cytochrome c family protein
MITRTKKTTFLTAGTLFVSLVLGFSLSTSAQDKPKGKPWAAPESAVKMKNPVKPDDASIKEGKELYAQHCKSCHGVKGKGDGTKAEKLDISCGDFTSDDFAKLSEGEAYWKTTEGRKPMPSFKEKLGDNERWSVINYVRTLGKEK